MGGGKPRRDNPDEFFFALDFRYCVDDKNCHDIHRDPDGAPSLLVLIWVTFALM
jgi:hypothetical protein